MAAGHDAPIEPQMMLYYHGCGLMTRSARCDRSTSSRDGSLLGEGAAALVLETEAPRPSEAQVLGEILGGGCASEATGLLALRDDGDGPARAIALALDDAGSRPPTSA